MTLFEIMLQLVLVGLLIAVCAGADNSSKPIERWDNSLRQVHIIFRHGDRTPDSSIHFDNNPYANVTYFPYGPGELTSKGKRTAYSLGKILRSRYGRFLGSLYYKGLLSAHSSRYDRVEMTLQTVLTSMFPPDVQIIPGLNWQPIPYVIACPDNLISVQLECPRILNVTTQVDAPTQELYDYLGLMTNKTIRNSIDVINIQNTLQVQEELGYPVPEWAEPIWPEPLLHAAMQAWEDVTTEYLPDIMGNLLHKMVTDSKAKINKEITEKLFLYSAHDMNIVAILQAMKSYHKQYIKYCAFVTVELHELYGVFGYKVFAYNYDTPQPYLLHIPNCGYFCPVDQFEKKIVKDLYKGDNWCK